LIPQHCHAPATVASVINSCGCQAGGVLRKEARTTEQNSAACTDHAIQTLVTLAQLLHPSRAAHLPHRVAQESQADCVPPALGSSTQQLRCSWQLQLGCWRSRAFHTIARTAAVRISRGGCSWWQWLLLSCASAESCCSCSNPACRGSPPHLQRARSHCLLDGISGRVCMAPVCEQGNSQSFVHIIALLHALLSRCDTAAPVVFA
jgi:hypothetical protein